MMPPSANLRVSILPCLENKLPGPNSSVGMTTLTIRLREKNNAVREMPGRDLSDQLYRQALSLDLRPRPVGRERRQSEPHGGSHTSPVGQSEPEMPGLIPHHGHGRLTLAEGHDG
jgi:hypothetical protein